jgi:hypothetical protein
MHIENVEIYSDKTNRAILRHPSRNFPGILVQGDDLNSLCQNADHLCATAKGSLDPESYGELNTLRNALWDYLVHYKAVLGEHGIPLPFSG